MKTNNMNLATSLFIPLEIIVMMLKNFLIGLKFIFFDCVGLLYYTLSGGVDKAYKVTKNTISNEEKKPSKFALYYSNLGFVKKARLKEEKTKEAFLKNLENEKRLDTPVVFKFKARNAKGKMITGTFIGVSKQDVNAFLVNEGYVVYNIETSKAINFLYGTSSILTTKITTKDLIFWLTQLSTYIKAGITLVDSVRILSSQLGKNASKKRIFDAIIYELVMGTSFSKALEKLGSTFPGLVINMVKAAEATGELPEALDDLASYYTELDKTKKQMVSAAAYPAAITFFALGVIGFIMVYVIPKFVTIYESADVEINGLTKAIINSSDYLRSNLVVILAIIVLVIIFLMIAYKYLKGVRILIQKIAMHIPVVKNIIIYNEITIFTKTFASLLKNNVYITDSIDILSRVTKNEIYKEIMYRTINNIASGDKISDSFKEHWAVPQVAYFMIVTGESTGELAKMMQKVSEYYQEMHRNIVNNLKSFIEPIMITCLAVIVGVIILAVIIPMFDLYGNIQ